MKNNSKCRVLIYSLIDLEATWNLNKNDSRLYGYDKMRDSFNLTVINIKRINRRKRIFSDSIIKLYLQIRIILCSFRFDVIYAPHDTDISLILLSKYFGILKPSLLIIGHYSYNGLPYNGFKKYLRNLQRFILSKGKVKVIFLSENLLKESGWFSQDWACYAPWGPTNFYRPKDSNDKGYLLALGKVNRDYDLLKRFAQQSNSKIVLASNNTNIDFSQISSVRLVDIERGFSSKNRIGKLYRNCSVVLVLLQNDSDHVSGATVISEAIFHMKPVIVTRQTANYFDVEEANLGIFIDRNSIKSLNSAIDRLNDVGYCDYHKFVENHLNYSAFEKFVVNEISICCFG